MRWSPDLLRTDEEHHVAESGETIVDGPSLDVFFLVECPNSHFVSSMEL